jgi:hypothetical protein
MNRSQIYTVAAPARSDGDELEDDVDADVDGELTEAERREGREELASEESPPEESLEVSVDASGRNLLSIGTNSNPSGLQLLNSPPVGEDNTNPVEMAMESALFVFEGLSIAVADFLTPASTEPNVPENSAGPSATRDDSYQTPALTTRFEDFVVANLQAEQIESGIEILGIVGEGLEEETQVELSNVPTVSVLEIGLGAAIEFANLSSIGDSPAVAQAPTNIDSETPSETVVDRNFDSSESLDGSELPIVSAEVEIRTGRWVPTRRPHGGAVLGFQVGRGEQSDVENGELISSSWEHCSWQRADGAKTCEEISVLQLIPQIGTIRLVETWEHLVSGATIDVVSNELKIYSRYQP